MGEPCCAGPRPITIPLNFPHKWKTNALPRLQPEWIGWQEVGDNEEAIASSVSGDSP